MDVKKCGLETAFAILIFNPSSFFQLVWIETPTNPLLKIADIKALSAIAHEQKDVIVVVDNTFASPYFQVR